MGDREAVRRETRVIQRVGHTMVVPLPANPDIAVAAALYKDVIAAVHHESPTAVIFDAAATTLMDSRVASSLNNTARGIRLLGSIPILAGLSPALCSALTRLDIEFPDFAKTINLDRAFAVASAAVSVNQS